MVHSGATEKEPDRPGEPAPRKPEFAVALASRNQGDTIAWLIDSLARGIAAGYPEGGVQLIQADCGSTDDTTTRARESLGTSAVVLTQLKVPSETFPVPGGSAMIDAGALRCILEEARRLEVRGCAVLDGQVRSIPPVWVERLIRPLVEEQLDFLAPYYLRHPFDGTITSGIAYPLQRALYGKRIRFPLATDFACSQRFIGALLAGRDAGGPAELARVGAETWLLTRAASGDFRLGQTFLGVKESGSAEAPGNEVVEVLGRVLSGLFLEMERQAAVWQKVRHSKPVPLFGSPQPVSPEPRGVDVGRALESFRLGERNLQEVWRAALSPAELVELARLARSSDDGFRFPDGLWARIVYDFGLAHRLRVMSRDHLLAAFAPLYQGWLAGFALELPDPNPQAAERRIEELCLRFEAEKPYLIARWRWPDRFNP